jgi:hypothetical protein
MLQADAALSTAWRLYAQFGANLLKTSFITPTHDPVNAEK